MLDLNEIRRAFAQHLLEHAATRFSLDAALMHVVGLAYQQGNEDALSVPDVLAEPVATLERGVADGVRGAVVVGAAVEVSAGVVGAAGGVGAGGGVEGGDDAVAPVEPERAVKGGALARLAAMWCADEGFQRWLRWRFPVVWAAHAARPGSEVLADVAASVVRELCGVVTRAELDHDSDAQAFFNRMIRLPYAEHLKGLA